MGCTGSEDKTPLGFTEGDGDPAAVTRPGSGRAGTHTQQSPLECQLFQAPSFKGRLVEVANGHRVPPDTDMCKRVL